MTAPTRLTKPIFRADAIPRVGAQRFPEMGRVPCGGTRRLQSAGRVPRLRNGVSFQMGQCPVLWKRCLFSFGTRPLPQNAALPERGTRPFFWKRRPFSFGTRPALCGTAMLALIRRGLRKTQPFLPFTTHAAGLLRRHLPSRVCRRKGSRENHLKNNRSLFPRHPQLPL